MLVKFKDDGFYGYPPCATTPARALRHCHEIVTKRQEITIRITYPLTIHYSKTFSRPQGWTTGALFQAVKSMYRHVYRFAETANDYGVWGHSLDDLVFVDISGDFDDLRVGVDS